MNVVRGISIACWLVLVTNLSGFASAENEPVPRPEWSIGDWWEFVDGASTWRLTVIGRERDYYVLATSPRGVAAQDGNGRTTYHADLDGWITKTIARDGKVTESGDKREWVKFPLTVGRRWFFSVMTTIVGGPASQHRMVDYEAQPEGWETIDVGGRSVRALRIHYAQRLRGASAYGGNVTGWYAPEAKRLVRLKPSYEGGPKVEAIGFGIRDGGPAVTAAAQPVAPSARPSAPRPVMVEFKAPAGAIVSVAGQRHDVGPDGALSVALPSGHYELTATCAGYEPWRSTLVVDGSAGRIPYTIRMTTVTPPTIAVREPAAGQLFHGADGRIRATVSSAYRVASLTARQPGAAQRLFSPPQAQGTGEPWDIVIGVNLAEGDNTVDLEARDEHGGTTQQSVTLRRETPRPVPVTAPARPMPETKPPHVVLNYPQADLTIERDRISVVGVATAEAGIATVQVTVNEAVVTPTSQTKAGSRSGPVRATVPLIPGDNVIEVTVTDKLGNIAQVVRMVTRPDAKSATAAGVGTPAANHLAVVIGVGRYDHKQIPSLRYTVPDAEAIARVLIDSGFKSEHVLLLTDKTERKPTLRNIKWALGTFLTRLAKKDDTVLIFFAGHGAPEVDPRGFERDGFAKYLIPSDADPDDLYSTALPMDELHTIFSRLESDRIVALLDSCYSGAAGGRTFATKRTRALNVDDEFLERLTRSRGRVIVTAARATEVSIELPELGHGLFTYHLVGGLTGGADANRDGIVSLQELYEYVERQVSQKSRAVGANQHPVMKGEMEGILPLARVRKP